MTVPCEAVEGCGYGSGMVQKATPAGGTARLHLLRSGPHIFQIKLDFQFYLQLYLRRTFFFWRQHA